MGEPKIRRAGRFIGNSSPRGIMQRTVFKNGTARRDCPTGLPVKREATP